MWSEDNKQDTYNQLKEECGVDEISNDNDIEKKMDPFFNIVIDQNGDEVFLCLYENCFNVERNEADLIIHLNKHFSQYGEFFREYHQTFKNEIECIDLTDDITQENEVDSQTLDKNTSEIKLKIEWDRFIGEGIRSGKRQFFFCYFVSDCNYSSDSLDKMKNHIQKHFENIGFDHIEKRRRY